MNRDKGASAYVILSPDESEVIKKGVFVVEHETSQRAELHAIIEGCREMPANSYALIKTDSQYSILVLGRKRDVKGQANPDLIAEYRRIVKESKLKVEFEWVKGHSGNTWNELCDQLCDDAAGIDLNDYKQYEKPKEPKKAKGTKKKGAFKAPTVKDINAFCKKEGLNVNCERFFCYYEARDWKKGAQKMRSWRITCREWHIRQQQWDAERRALE